MKVLLKLVISLYMWLHQIYFLVALRKEQVENSDFQKRKEKALEP